MNTATDLRHLPWHWIGEDRDPCLKDVRLDLDRGQVRARVDAVAQQLHGYGVGPGTVVAVMLPNCVELTLVILAAWRLRAAVTPVNPQFTARELRHQLTDSDAILLVAAQSWITAIPALDVTELATDRIDQVDLDEPDVRPDDLALVVYTSGTTGVPKGVMLDHANLDAMIASMTSHVALTPEDHCLLVLPLFHVNALCVSFLASVASGGRLTILERFHPLEFAKAVRSLRPTYFSAVPAIYASLVALPDDVPVDMSSVRFAICGAAPVSAALLRRVTARLGVTLVQGYGLTEATCASTCQRLGGPIEPGSVGPTLPGQKIRVVDEHGADVPAGTRGEVVISGPTVMRGYLGRSEETARAIIDGWLRTGDIGVLDRCGALTIVGRIKELIIRGGENLYPKEIESVLAGHPDVAEAVVVGAPDARLGEVPLAFVTTGGRCTVDDLHRLVERDLTKVKWPVHIEIVTTLPRNPIGKIDKEALRRRAGELRHR
jgi:acyl-CoA synthetase (AMP-forming)/AMP-acid ligase II